MKKTFLAGLAALLIPALGLAGEYNLTVDRVEIDTGDFVKEGIGYNGASPGPVLRFKEGEEVTINVTNNLDEMTSIHWHGLILHISRMACPVSASPESNRAKPSPIGFRLFRRVPTGFTAIPAFRSQWCLWCPRD